MKKQILTLLGVGTLTYLSSGGLTLETKAALTAPTNWDYKYYNLGNTGPGARWSLTDGTNNAFDLAYERTADGSYYNYSQTISHLTSSFSFLPNGLSITMTFNRSNSSWISTGTGLYYPGNYVIGSDNTVGTISNKVYLEFVNNTNNDYLLHLDTSSSSSAGIWTLQYNNNTNANGLNRPSVYPYGYLIPSQFTLKIGHISFNTNIYFDAWYLQDLGVSDSYTQGQTDGFDDGYAAGYNEGLEQNDNQSYENGFNEGYDEGYDDGLNATASSAVTDYRNIFTMAFGAIASIYNINIFGGLTFGTIIVAPIAVALLWFILGLVSGVGGKK